ncbi:response regulator [Roseobacter sp. YSTF-M11]|uniref:Response regulator n=1 Tax=Roseobacter insulae TaxID=2859783 RepID=A0A9X1FZP9_9RHOB|nr:response regulator [Roseobacter insulae]MBW4710661.1 response regulator [Roseobacter insulae]
MNILLVEDNDVDVLLFQRALRNAGTQSTVVRAKDGVEALEILNAQGADKQVLDPYVILLDINMPRMNGHEFLKELRASEDIPGSRVVVVTTSSDPKDIELAYGSYASGYVVKPSGTAEMTKVIDTLHNYWGVCEQPVRRCDQQTQ